jgi:hypothetical protein
MRFELDKLRVEISEEEILADLLYGQGTGGPGSGPELNGELLRPLAAALPLRLRPLLLAFLQRLGA